jgi:DNA-binding GntR family transcriptional regulator
MVVELRAFYQSSFYTYYSPRAQLIVIQMIHHDRYSYLVARCPGKEDAGILETVPGSALLMIKAITYNTQEIPVQYSISLLRGHR